MLILRILWGPGMAQWLRRCATSRTVRGSIPGGVTGFCNDVFFPTSPWPWGRLCPLVKMSTRNISGGKGGRCVRMTTSPPLSAECQKSGRLNLLEPSGSHRDSYGTALPLLLYIILYYIILYYIILYYIIISYFIILYYI